MNSTPLQPQGAREAVARIIDDLAFNSLQSMFDYCVRLGEDERTARKYADNTHGPACATALAKADAILALLSEPPVEARAVHLVFHDFPSHEPAQFIEAETPDGKSINAGEWRKRDDGLVELVIQRFGAEQ